MKQKDGGIAQELQHAFDQVREWHDEVQRHWGATLDCMGLSHDEVAGVRGVVIAGRDGGYASRHLMRLKGADYGQVEFYTYDDLLSLRRAAPSGRRALLSGAGVFEIKDRAAPTED